VKSSRLQLRKCCFSQKVISSWNKLPGHVIGASSVNSFIAQADNDFVMRLFNDVQKVRVQADDIK